MSPIGSVFSASIATHHAASSASGGIVGRPLSHAPCLLHQQLLSCQLDDPVFEQLQAGEGLVLVEDVF